jgi:hypothetical protein
MKFSAYNISGPIDGVCKQHAIWGGTENQHMPLVYLQRPKWIKDDEAWQRIVDSVSLNLMKTDEIA